MNNVLELKGKRFGQSNKPINGGGIAMNGRFDVTTNHIRKLYLQLIKIKEFWSKEIRPFEGVIISVYYNKIVAKSNRISGLFKGQKSNLSIVGAKFNENKTKHIITYYLTMKDLDKSIELLNNAEEILKSKFEGKMNKSLFEDKQKININIFIWI